MRIQISNYFLIVIIKVKVTTVDTIKEVFKYREMIFSMVRRDLRGKYQRSVFGFLWTFLNPLFQLMVYTIMFTVLFPNNMIEKFYLFLFIGLVPWLFFSICLSAGAGAVLRQESLVKKIYFPRVVLPISFVTSEFINMLLTFVVVFLAIMVSGLGIDFRVIVALPFIMLIEYIFALGITMLFSAITVYVRDLEHILSIVAMAWMYLTPILYDIDTIPEAFRKYIYINPMTSIIMSYKKVLYYKEFPLVSTLILALVEAIIVFFIGACTFIKLQKRFVEEL